MAAADDNYGALSPLAWLHRAQCEILHDRLTLAASSSCRRRAMLASAAFISRKGQPHCGKHHSSFDKESCSIGNFGRADEYLFKSSEMQIQGLQRALFLRHLLVALRCSDSCAGGSDVSVQTGSRSSANRQSNIQ